MSGGPSSEARSRVGLAAETAILVLLVGLALGWVIPAQTRGGGLGLSPGILPTVCAAGIGILILLDGLLRIAPSRRPPRYRGPWRALLVVGGLAAVGGFLLDLAGAAATAAVILPLGFVALGERRWPLIAAVAAAVTASVAILSR